jgi:hypothetical protein
LRDPADPWAAYRYAAVERIWPGETVAILASGPSLTQADADYVRGKARVIVVNTTYKIAPWADVLWACDARWWQWHRGAKDFKGLKYAMTKAADRWPGVKIVRNTGTNGLEHDRRGLRNGRNGGYQAINLAVHLGAAKIVLLGFDMQRGPKGQQHWHEDHPSKMGPNYSRWLPIFETLVQPLKKAGVEIVNCTRSTALECFPRAQLETVL